MGDMTAVGSPALHMKWIVTAWILTGYRLCLLVETTATVMISHHLVGVISATRRVQDAARLVVNTLDVVTVPVRVEAMGASRLVAVAVHFVDAIRRRKGRKIPL